MTTHACPAPRCGSIVDDRFFACRKHWYMLPEPLRNRVSNAARAKTQRQDGADVAYLIVAREAVQFLVEVAVPGRRKAGS